MRREAPLKGDEACANDIIDDEIDRARKDERQIGDERIGAEFSRATLNTSHRVVSETSAVIREREA